AYTFQAAAAGLVGSPVVFTSMHGPFRLAYTDPPAGGKLRLVRNASSTAATVVLDFVVGAQGVTGDGTGFDLPLDVSKGQLGPPALAPGAALNPGSPPAAKAVLPASGALKGALVAALSQKAAGGGAVATDTALVPGALLFTIRLDLAAGAAPGVVFDGTVASFALPSGGLR